MPLAGDCPLSCPDGGQAWDTRDSQALRQEEGGRQSGTHLVLGLQSQMYTSIYGFRGRQYAKVLSLQ